MKKTILVLFFYLFASSLKAQSSAEDSVKAGINKMFTAIKNSDAKSLHECFADSAILQTITRSGKIQTDKVDDFVSQISSLPKDAADERISFDVIKVDDALAVVWTPYEFYYNGKFSHCGVNSFQLVRINGAWKIQYIIDTRRKNNCK